MRVYFPEERACQCLLADGRNRRSEANGKQRVQEAPRVIEAIDLTVRRSGRAVLEAVSFDVRPGHVTGVLGGMGAGKTTLLRRMVQLERGGGETLFDGRPYRAVRHPIREVGLALDGVVGHPDHTVRGHLRLLLASDRRAALDPDRRGAGRSRPGSGLSRVFGGRARPSHRVDAVLDIVGLDGERRTRLAELTEGMATRLAIAAALLGDPKVLLLDCPDRGLEPQGVAWLGELLRAFTGQGRAALVTCSDTETLVGFADRILLLDSGYLVGARNTEEVLRAPTGAAVIVRSPQIVRFAELLAEAGARSTQGEGASLEVRGLDRARIGDLAYRHGVPLHELAERYTGSHPADIVLAACSGRSRQVVKLRTVAPAPVGAGVIGVAASEDARVSTKDAVTRPPSRGNVTLMRADEPPRGVGMGDARGEFAEKAGVLDPAEPKAPRPIAATAPSAETTGANVRVLGALPDAEGGLTGRREQAEA
jgi:ABC-2 type transport system ATP-binding protein